AEALLRLETDEGFISPEKFIPLAEDSGLIIPLGEWVLSDVCRQLREWHEAGCNSVRLAANISVKQFSDPDFIVKMEKIIVDSGIDTQFLTLELTESLLLVNVEEKIRLLKRLKEMGVKLSIDDFGTGYSSLSYLRKLPVDELKIDRSFIMEVTEHADSRAIVSTIVFLAKNLNLSTVAEGIEKKEELDFLKDLGCNQYQGFYFSRAIPAGNFFELLSQNIGETEGISKSI
ncbi:MAG: EAL domain-containing protein, partial [bacterium]|nr:EAL domain-containing protein [bacterium]